MGVLGPVPQETCKRGHELTKWTTRPATNGGRNCIACDRARSHAWALRARKRIYLTPEQFDAKADEYYALIQSALKNGL